MRASQTGSGNYSVVHLKKGPFVAAIILARRDKLIALVIAMDASTGFERLRLSSKEFG